MKNVLKKVKYGGKEVGSVNVPIYETIDELANNEAAESILARFNQGNAIFLMGQERNKHKPATVGKRNRAFIGFNVLTQEEIASCKGDPTALRNLIESEAVQARIDEYLEEQGEETE